MDLINRRQFVAASASALMLGAPQLAQAQAKPKLRFSAAFPETDLRAEAYKAFAAAMKDDFDFEPYWANTLFKQGTELVALQRDNLEVCNLAPADISKQIQPGRCLPPPTCFATTTTSRRRSPATSARTSSKWPATRSGSR